MKGIILAGGVGSRLRPVTHVLNKNLLPVYNKPAIFYSIELFKSSGVTDLCIIAENNHIDDFRCLLGNGVDFDVDIEFVVDSPLRKGPASAVHHAKKFANGEPTIIVFADGIYDICIKDSVDSFEDGAIIFVKQVDDPKRFGIVEVDENGSVLSIEEKPQNPKSNFAQTGLAIYDENVFDYLDGQNPASDGEYYLTDINIKYLKEGKLKAQVIDCFWQDVGTFDGLLTASNYFHQKDIH